MSEWTDLASCDDTSYRVRVAVRRLTMTSAVDNAEKEGRQYPL